MDNLRIEKKFVAGKYKEDIFKKLLLTNNFKKIYPDRIINSIYIDTVNYDFVKDNINGINERKKIRIRWYNDDLNNIFMENKNKKNFNIWKNISKINVSINKEKFIENLKKIFFQSSNIYNNSNNFKFILKTNYKRSYWLSNNQKIRATIDTDINTSPISNLTRQINLPETILEFKFSPKFEKYFRNLFLKKKFNIRSHKYSKYVQSFIALENSGLIN